MGGFAKSLLLTMHYRDMGVMVIQIADNSTIYPTAWF